MAAGGQPGSIGQVAPSTRTCKQAHLSSEQDQQSTNSCRRSYALAVVELLDPTGKLFGPRLIAQVCRMQTWFASFISYA